MQLAFRVDVYTESDPSPFGVANGHKWVAGDVFSSNGQEWVVSAVIVQFVDHVNYPAMASELLVAGNRERRESVIVESKLCTLLESD